jgi:hypothetical protein
LNKTQNGLKNRGEVMESFFGERNLRKVGE